MSTSALAITPKTQAAAPNLAALKSRQQAAWSSGDYAIIGTTLQIVGENLCEALDLRSGQSVLDVAAGNGNVALAAARRWCEVVAAGNGNVALAAARRWCEVVATDYVPALLERARARAAADGLRMEFREADAEALPFDDESFDAVVSTFGVMFTPDQERAAAELVRVCRRGGKIGLANWSPDSFIGQLFKTIARYVPPPAGVRSPALWGNPARLEELFGQHGVTITTTARIYAFRYRSPEHWLDVFRTYYGPTLKTFAALPPEAQSALASDLLALVYRFNQADDGTMVTPSEYLEVVVTRR